MPGSSPGMTIFMVARTFIIRLSSSVSARGFSLPDFVFSPFRNPPLSSEGCGAPQSATVLGPRLTAHQPAIFRTPGPCFRRSAARITRSPSARAFARARTIPVQPLKAERRSAPGRLPRASRCCRGMRQQRAPPLPHVKVPHERAPRWAGCEEYSRDHILDII